MRKRTLCLALALCLSLTGLALVESAPASDGAVTRADFVAILAEADGADLSAYEDAESPFSDADGAALGWAWEKWLVNGDGDGRFRPDDPITRQEAAAILGRYLDYRFTELPAGCGTGAPETDNIAEWAQQGVMKCWLYGVIDTGDEPDFVPLGTVSEAEAREMAKNAAELSVSALGAPEEQSFADALVSALEEAGAQGSAAGNRTVSPYSVRLCLAMLANGAGGDTQKELLSALGTDDLDALNGQIKEQLETYDGYARVMSLNTANSVWLNQSAFGGAGELKEGFSDAMTLYYRAESREVTNENSVESVNEWVNEKTNGKISDILSEDNRGFALALVNAVYFKAAWENEFYEGNTEKGGFTNADGSVSETELMHSTDYFGYYSTPGVQAVKLDYRNYAADNGDGDNYERFSDADFSMYIILADDELDVDYFLDTAEFESGLVRVTLPKFKVEYSVSLNDALRALGVSAAFDPAAAELSGMADLSSAGGRLYVTDALHKTYISVDERGTEAAAVTALITEATATPPEREPLVREFTADRPFYYAIRDNASGELLFVGRYETAE